MTDETEFSTYTHRELCEAVDRAVEEQRQGMFAGLMIWMLWGVAVGFAIGLGVR